MAESIVSFFRTAVPGRVTARGVMVVLVVVREDISYTRIGLVVEYRARKCQDAVSQQRPRFDARLYGSNLQQVGSLPNACCGQLTLFSLERKMRLVGRSRNGVPVAMLAKPPQTKPQNLCC